MQENTQVSYSWRHSLISLPYSTGVSLHSHTSVSEESLTFIHKLGLRFPGVAQLIRHYAAICRDRYGVMLDFERANWRPPLQPRMAYDVEHRQIQRLGLMPLVSLTDHDSIEAPMLLRTVPSVRHIPVSTEWSVPFGSTAFHLGVHNLPSADGPEWMRRFTAFTANPSDNSLRKILRELHGDPQILIVLNHPLWDLYTVGEATHLAELRRFLTECGACIHALELNGLRHARENRAVSALARDTGHLLVSGGDRHGLEANANINLTDATNFREFVHEIRVERHSHIFFMDQYAHRWEQRIVSSTLDAVTDFSHFMPGWQRWDDRVYHPDADGQMRQLSQLWAHGRVPPFVGAVIRATRLARLRAVRSPLSLAFPGVNDLSPDLETI